MPPRRHGPKAPVRAGAVVALAEAGDSMNPKTFRTQPAGRRRATAQPRSPRFAWGPQ
jgi:hypothetical protein